MKDRLKNEVREMESQLLQMSIDEATGSSSNTKPIKILPNAPAPAETMAQMRRRVIAEQEQTIVEQQREGGIKLLPVAPKLTELQKRMLADGPGKDIYQRTAGGTIH